MHKRDKIRISGQQFFTFRINKDIMVSFTIIRNEKKNKIIFGSTKSLIKFYLILEYGN